MGNITTRAELIDYALRELGHPVIEINVDRSQLEDRVNDALDLFWEFHADGSELTYLTHKVTAEDISNGFIELPTDILSVLKLMNLEGSATGIANVNVQYQAYLSDMMNISRITRGGLSSYYITDSFLALTNNTLNTPKRIDFNHHHGKLFIHGGWSNIPVDTFLGIECYKRVSSEDAPEIYNSRWLKRYVVALFKRQWGNNLIKYGNAQLPGGMTINAETFYNDGRADCTALEEELRNDYEYPCDFYMG